MPKCCTCKRFGYLFIVGGVLWALFAIFAVPLLPDVVRSVLVSQRVINSPDSLGYDQYKDNTVGSNPIIRHTTFYVMNVTNPQAVLNGSKPHLDKIGPFVYETKTFRYDLTFPENGKYAKFKLVKSHVFKPSLSSADPKTVNLVMFDLAMQGIWGTLKTINLQLLMGQPQLFGGKTPFDRLFVRKTAHEMLWGYNDTQLAFLHAFTKGSWPTMCPLSAFPGLATNQSEADLPNIGHTSVHTGKAVGGKFTNNIQQLVKFDNQSSVDFWNGTFNQIRGTNGDNVPMGLGDQQSVAIYVPDLKRTTDLVPLAGAHPEVKGIPLRRYVLNPRRLQNASVVPENANIWNFGPDGLFNLTTTRWLVPLFNSEPNFLGAAPSLREGVTGLEAPNAERDQLPVDVEPFSGITMNVRRSYMVSLHAAPLQ